MEEHNSISEVRIAPFPQHSPPAPSCQGLSYSFSEPFHEEMKLEYFGGNSPVLEGSRAVSADPALGARAAGCPLLSPAPRAALGMLCAILGQDSSCAKKHQLTGLIFAQKEQTPPPLEQALLWLCAALVAEGRTGTGFIHWYRQHFHTKWKEHQT